MFIGMYKKKVIPEEESRHGVSVQETDNYFPLPELEALKRIVLLLLCMTQWETAYAKVKRRASQDFHH